MAEMERSTRRTIKESKILGDENGIFTVLSVEGKKPLFPLLRTKYRVEVTRENLKLMERIPQLEGSAILNKLEVITDEVDGNGKPLKNLVFERKVLIEKRKFISPKRALKAGEKLLRSS